MADLRLSRRGWLREARSSFRASPVFSLVVLITLGLAGLIGLMTLLMQVLPRGFLGMAHFTEPAHGIHDLTYGLLFTTAIVGLVAQLRRPADNLAGMAMALMPWVGLVVAGALSDDPRAVLSAERMLVGTGSVLAAFLHPSGRLFLRSFRASRVSPVMLGLVAVATVPLIGFAATNLELQAAAGNEHAAQGHYGFLAAFGFTAIGVGLVASLRPVGWRLAAWVAGALPLLFGLASVANRAADSSISPGWTVAAVAWGALFIGAGVMVPDPQGSPRLSVAAGAPHHRKEGSQMAEPSYPRPGMPRWVKLSGIAVAGIAVLLVVLVLTGVFGEHGPEQFGPGQHLP